MTATQRQFSPIFVATITASNVETKVSGKGARYLLCREATFARRGRPAQKRTVMSFGPAADKLRGLLQTGKPIDLAVQYDGGTIKALGVPRPQQVRAGADAPRR